MTLREQIEAAAEDFEYDRPQYALYTKHDLVDFAFAQVEKETAPLVEALDAAIKDREYFRAELHTAEKDIAELITDRNGWANAHQEMRYERDNADRQAREECIQILANSRTKDDLGFPLQPDGVIAENVRAIRATIKG